MISSFTFVCEIPRDFNSVLKSTLKKIDFKPTLAFCFVSIDFPLKQIMDSFQQYGINLFGTTSAGEILFDSDGDIMLNRGAVLVLTDIPASSFQLQLLKMDNFTQDVFGKEAGEIIKQRFKEPSVLTSFSGLGKNIQAVIDNILIKTRSQLKMYGCLAGDDLKLEKALVFTEKEITDCGAIFLILDDEKIGLNGMTTSGWNGLGTDFTVTHSEENVVSEIDNIPALDFYVNYLNILEEDLPMIGLEYPLMIKHQDGTFSLRAINKIDKEKRSLIFSSSIKSGTVFSFSASPGFEILEKTREKVIAFYEKNQSADLMFLYSAVARQLATGPLINTEIKLAAIKWRVPLVGCFNYGEIAKDNDQPSKFYNQSFTLALLTEKPAPSL
ncbi:MAG: FIST C-terminal domain-containing protein [Bacteroidales bacterium]|nr:FIST C-terminal domain-containing protein [Bacteroidales bacterium]